jgi:hypothetical protein
MQQLVDLPSIRRLEEIRVRRLLLGHFLVAKSVRSLFVGLQMGALF